MNQSFMTLSQAQSMLPGAVLVGDGALALSRVHSDTRSVRAGDLFIALRGERFDAHEFLPQAAAAGAVAAIAQKGLAAHSLPGLLVTDTRKALAQLAAAWRRQFDIPVIAVTGSNGKTTVTQMIASILHAWRGGRAWATQGNFNNDIGVPLTLLGLRKGPDAHQVAVLELGMNHPGEIAELAALCAPTVALVNNAQREHQEFMASVQAVAEENGRVLHALGADGVAVFPSDDVYAPIWREGAGQRRMLTFALDTAADFTAQAQWAVKDGLAAWRGTVFTPEDPFELCLQVAGRHNLKNALAAAACAWAAGCPLTAIEQGLAGFQAVKGRSQVKALRIGARDHTLIDDSYNANPDSVRAAVDVLAALPGPRWLLLGDMGEVGEKGPQFHAEVGAYAAQRGIDCLWAVGEAAEHAAQAYEQQAGPTCAARHFRDGAEALQALAHPQAWPAFESVLVKGSRFMKMELLVQALLGAGSAAGFSGGSHAD